MYNKIMRSLTPPFRVLALAGLLLAILSLDGCTLFRAKPDAKAKELMSQLNVGLTPEEVLGRIGPPQRRGQNLFDKKKAYWIYEFASAPKRTWKWPWSRSTDGEPAETPPASELQLLFEQGALAGWDHVMRH